MVTKKTKPGPDPQSRQSKDAQFAGWYSRAIAAKKLGISLSTIIRKVDDGSIPATADSEGVWWFDPKEIDPLVPEAASEGSAAVIQATAHALKQAQDHNEVLLRHATDPSQAALRLIMRTNERLTLENKELRDREAENYKAREALLSEAHERELASRIVEARERRYEEGFKLLLGYAPMLITQMSGGKKLKPLLDVIESLEPEQIKFLVPDFLTEEQAQEILKLRESLKKAKPPKAPEPPKPEETEGATP